MKVVITMPLAARLGGAENLLWTTLRHINRDRVDPRVVFFEPGPFEREVAGLGIWTAVLPTGRLRQARRGVHAVRQLATLLRGQQPDLVFNWMAKAQLYGAPAAMLAGLSDRVMWWQHGVVIGWMDRLATALPTCAVIASSRGSAELQGRLLPRRRTLAVHPGVEEPQRESAEQLTTLREHLSIPAGRFVVGTVGRLQPGKGQHHVLRTVAILRDRGCDVHGLIVGGTAHGLSPKYEPQLRALATELGLTDAVTFTAHVPDSTPYVQLMDVSINASDRESFGIVLVESMALGIPVIAVDVAGPSEIVKHERSGLLVSRPEPKRLAAAVERLIRDPSLRRELALGGQNRFHARFTAVQMARRIESALEGVCVDQD